MFLFIALSAFTLFTLQRATLHYGGSGCQTYQEVVGAAFGPRVEVAFSILLMAKLYGIGIAYLLIIGDSLVPLLDNLASAPQPWYLKRTFIVSIFVAVVALPLCLLRTMRALGAASGVGVAAIAVTTAVIVANGVQYLEHDPPAPGIEPLAEGWDLLRPIGLVVFAFGFHLQCPQILAEIADPEASVHGKGESVVHVQVVAESAPRPPSTGRAAPSARTPLLGEIETDTDSVDSGLQLELSAINSSDERRLAVMNRGVILTLALTFVLQASTAALGYLQFGSGTPSNILTAYTSRSASASVARVAMALAVTLTLPLVQSTARRSLQLLLHRGFASLGWQSTAASLAQPAPPLLWHVLTTVVYVAVVWGIALVIDDVGVVFSILGVCVCVFVSRSTSVRLVCPNVQFTNSKMGASLHFHFRREHRRRLDQLFYPCRAYAPARLAVEGGRTLKGWAAADSAPRMRRACRRRQHSYCCHRPCCALFISRPRQF
jgi:amino acid permease